MESKSAELREGAPRYFPRDLSWLAFNARVLEEARDTAVPLYERLKFMAIYSSNLDEFSRVRVAELRRLAAIDKPKVDKEFDDEPKSTLAAVRAEVARQLELFGQTLRDGLLPALESRGVRLEDGGPLDEEHEREVMRHFRNRVLSYLQPVVLREGKEAFLEDGALYLAVALREKGSGKAAYGYVNVPSDKLPRFMPLSERDGAFRFLYLDDVVRRFVPRLFPGYAVSEAYAVKLNRDADLNIEDEYAGDLVEKIRKQIEKRGLGAPARFLYDSAMPAETLQALSETLGLSEDDLVAGGRYHNMSDLHGLPNPFDPALRDAKLAPVERADLEAAESVFESVARKDVALHFPYQSYDYVLRFFNEAAIDPAVTHIKATFYRVAEESFIVNALISAARNGKKVTAFVEVKARFDEANNLAAAERMERAGVRIIYSIPGLKVHAKVALVKREAAQEGEPSAFAYFGTGNFNEKTASLYADHALLTADPEMCEELDSVFKFLRKRKPVGELKRLLVAQFNMVDRFSALIQGEIEHALAGEESRIVVKVNNLEDPAMIEKLYEASAAGVKVELLVRSICRLVPGVRGQSANVRVVRLVDRYLEHARLFYFLNGGEERLLMGSADWMRRNLRHRVEIVFPVNDEQAQEELLKSLDLQLSDNAKACEIDAEGANRPVERGFNRPPVRAQMDYYYWLRKRAEQLPADESLNL